MPGGPAWSQDTGQAGWIAERLAPFGDMKVAPVVPGGFEAYAHVLHPTEVPYSGDRVVRWAQVAVWSGLPLRRDAQFLSVALPRRARRGRRPGRGRGRGKAAHIHLTPWPWRSACPAARPGLPAVLRGPVDGHRDREHRR
jgi:hypothetical protein